MDVEPTRFQLRLALLALVLVLLLLVIGAFSNGLLAFVQGRFWSDIVHRAGGPLSFRFYMQPTMAVLAALLDARRRSKAQSGGEQATLKSHLRESFIGSARILLLGLVIDMIYQWKELQQFYPGEAVVIAIGLAFVPYLLCRALTYKS